MTDPFLITYLVCVMLFVVGRTVFEITKSNRTIHEKVLNATSKFTMATGIIGLIILLGVVISDHP